MATAGLQLWHAPHRPYRITLAPLSFFITKASHMVRRRRMTRSALTTLYLCGLTRLALGNHCYGSAYQSCGVCTAGQNCAWCPSSCSCVMAPDASRVCLGTFQTGSESKCASICTLPTPPGENYFTSISSKPMENSTQVRATKPSTSCLRLT